MGPGISSRDPAAAELTRLLKNARESRGISRTDARRGIGVPHATIFEIEGGSGVYEYFLDLKELLPESELQRLIDLYKLDPATADRVREAYKTACEAEPRRPKQQPRRSTLQPQRQPSSAPVKHELRRDQPATRSQVPAPAKPKRKTFWSKFLGGVPAGGVFISYRRSDEKGLAGRLYDRLSDKFGEDRVFMDVDSIDLGSDYVDAVKQRINQCDAMIVVIGQRWLEARGDDDTRRLDVPNDLVRIEIESALKRDMSVIPILVEGARMPREAELPDSIKALARRNGRGITHERFKSDCQKLISTLEQIL